MRMKNPVHLESKALLGKGGGGNHRKSLEGGAQIEVIPVPNPNTQLKERANL